MIATEQKTGTLAVGAIIAAVLSFVLTFAGHPVFGLTILFCHLSSLRLSRTNGRAATRRVGCWSSDQNPVKRKSRAAIISARLSLSEATLSPRACRLTPASSAVDMITVVPLISN